MQEHTGTSISRVKQATEDSEQRLYTTIKHHTQTILDDIDNTATQTIDNIITKSVQQQLNKHSDILQQQATEMMVHLEDTYNDYLSLLKQHTPPVNTQKPKTQANSNWTRPIASRFAHVAHHNPDLLRPLASSTINHDFLFPPTTPDKAAPTRDPWGRASMTAQSGTHPTTPQNPISAHSVNGIAPLNHTHFINRAQFQYTGKIFTFYTQIYNSGPQYGVYLVPIDAVRHNQSLCPYSTNGHIFTE
jgi:hypothetical protein